MKKRIPRRLIALIGIAVAISAYSYLVFLPLKNATAQARADLEMQRLAILDSAPIKFRNESLQERIKAANRMIEVWKQASPPNGNLAGLFRQISDSAAERGVLLNRFDPGAVENLKVVGRSNVQLACTGGFHRVQSFIHAIEVMDQKIWIDDLSIRADDKKRGTVVADLTLSIFADNPE